MLTSYLQQQLPAYLSDLRTLSGIDSGTEHKAGVDAVQDWLARRLHSLGFTIERQAQTTLGDNLVVRLRGRGSKRMLLLGHADTVFPVGTTAQRPVTISGNIILGPGTCDMKAGLLTGIYAVQALQQAGFEDFGEIVLLVVSDEESGPRASVPLIQACARQADVAFTLEAARANGDIVTARKSSRMVTIEAFGKPAHSGVEPQKGRNAILAMARLLDKLDALNGFREGITLNVGKIEGGRQSNVVAEQCKVQIDLRAWRQQDMDDVIAAIHKLVAEPVAPSTVYAAMQASGAEVDESSVPPVRFSFSAPEDAGMPPMEKTPAIAALEALTIQTASELGFTVKGAATGGASDASYVAGEGTPVLDGMGPIGGLDHGPDEYIELDSIVPRTELLARVLMKVATD
ncbi:MAG: M20 family metallopeptidase [Caldilineaceae bacterium]